MSKQLLVWGCLIAASAAPAYAQTNTGDTRPEESITELREVVVSGTRFELPIEQSGKIIYTLSKQDLEQNAGKSVADLLNEVPGIQMDGNFGAPGTNLNLFARGGRSKNTLILIDGVPLNDPSGINASYDLRLLPLSQIESIEVLKGALSSLYGTGASTAVISITTKGAGENRLGGQVDASYGSFNTYSGSGALQGSLNRLSYFVAGNYLTSEGFSAASDEQATEPFNADGLQKQNALVKLGYDLTEGLNVQGTVAYDAFETEYDGGAFLDADNVQLGDMLRIGLVPKYQYAKGEITLKGVYAINHREFQSAYPVAYEGRNVQVDLSQKHTFSPSLTSFVGLNVQNFAFQQQDALAFEDTQFALIDPYASVFYAHGSGLSVHGGLRLNHHSTYGSKVVYNLNPSFLFDLNQDLSVKLLASGASSYITPTGFQLYSAYGNTDLGPEESLNVEGGAALYWEEVLTLNAVYFSRWETNAIDFVSLFDDQGNYIGGQYQNMAGTRMVQGLETDVEVQALDQLSLAANYSYVTTDDLSTFYRIPKNKWGARVNYQPGQRTTLSVKYNHTGERTLYDWASGGEVSLASYGLLDVYVQHTLLHQKLTVYGALNNLLNEDFVAIMGYTTRGRTFNAGLTYSF